MNEINWIYLETVSEMGVSYDEYVSEDGTQVKHIFNDGYVEIYETTN